MSKSNSELMLVKIGKIKRGEIIIIIFNIS